MNKLIEDIERLYRVCDGWSNGNNMLTNRVQIMTSVNFPFADMTEKYRKEYENSKNSWIKGSLVEYERYQDELERQFLIKQTSEVYGRFVGLPFIGDLYPPMHVTPLEDDNYIVTTARGQVFVGTMCEEYYKLMVQYDLDQIVLSKYQYLLVDVMAAMMKSFKDANIDTGDLEMEIDEINRKIEQCKCIAGYRRVMIDHMHAAPLTETEFYNYVYYEEEHIRIMRGRSGYHVYTRLKNDSGMDIARIFMNNNPITHLKYIEFSDVKGMDSDPKLIQIIKQDLSRLREKEIYMQLVHRISMVEYKSNEYYILLNYLRTSHYLVYRQKSSGQVFVFSGSPGCGKTEDMMKLTGDTDGVYSHSYDAKTKQYFDGYYGQPIFTIDDIGHYSSDEWKILLKLVTPASQKLPMAVASSKDLVPINAEEIYVTTNNIDNLMKMDRVSRDAICRRVEVFEYVQGDELVIYHKVYNRSTGLFRTVQVLSRPGMYQYFMHNVVRHRQYPCFVNNKWYNFVELNKILYDINPFLARVVDAVGKTFNVSQIKHYKQITYAICLILSSGRHRKVISQLMQHDYNNFSMSNRLKRFFGKQVNNVLLTPNEREWSRRVGCSIDNTLSSEGANIVCVRANDIENMSPIAYCNDLTPILPHIKAELTKRVRSRIMERVEHIQARPVTQYARDQAIVWDCVDELFDVPARDIIVRQHQTYIEPGDSIIDKLYDTGKWVIGEFLPTNLTYTDYIDESDYRPTSGPTKRISRDSFHKLCQLLLSVRSANKTAKRREQRRRAALTMGVVSN